jgi:putative phosphoribosyl transferase
MNSPAELKGRPVEIDTGTVWLGGELFLPPPGNGLVIFVHGSGSSRHSPRNQFVAGLLREAGLGTLLFDLLTREEELSEQETRHLRFDIDLLADRLRSVTQWLRRSFSGPLGFFGASTGAAAALVAASRMGEISAIVSRGGRPDLAGPALSEVRAPTLLIVGGNDHGVIELNEAALQQLRAIKQMTLVPGASHLFEESGTLAQAATLAAQWFQKYLVSRD